MNVQKKIDALRHQGSWARSEIVLRRVASSATRLRFGVQQERGGDDRVRSVSPFLTEQMVF